MYHHCAAVESSAIIKHRNVELSELESLSSFFPPARKKAFWLAFLKALREKRRKERKRKKEKGFSELWSFLSFFFSVQFSFFFSNFLFWSLEWAIERIVKSFSPFSRLKRNNGKINPSSIVFRQNKFSPFLSFFPSLKFNGGYGPTSSSFSEWRKKEKSWKLKQVFLRFSFSSSSIRSVLFSKGEEEEEKRFNLIFEETFRRIPNEKKRGEKSLIFGSQKRQKERKKKAKNPQEIYFYTQKTLTGWPQTFHLVSGHKYITP